MNKEIIRLWGAMTPHGIILNAFTWEITIVLDEYDNVGRGTCSSANKIHDERLETL